MTTARSGGFSLIELMVVVAIITIFTSFSLARTPSLGGSVRLENSLNAILSAFRQARHDSISVAKFGALNVYPSYGVYVQEGGTTLTIYADCIADDTGGANPIVDENDTFYFGAANNCGGASAVSKTITLDQNITISDIGVKQAGAGAFTTTAANMSVQFLRPHPLVWIVTQTGGARTVHPNAEAYIDILDARTNTTRRVTINTNGLVYAN
jgi:prepilin-type N-terminal cleavage/methylation domain-containing protein